MGIGEGRIRGRRVIEVRIGRFLDGDDFSLWGWKSWFDLGYVLEMEFIGWIRYVCEGKIEVYVILRLWYVGEGWIGKIESFLL